MQQGQIEFQQVTERGRHVLATSAPRRGGRIVQWLRARALKKLTYDLGVQTKACSVAYVCGDMKAYRAHNDAARDISDQIDAIASGGVIPIDATDVWRGVVLFTVLFWGGFFLLFPF